MKIIGYAIASRFGFERLESEVLWRKRMKELHQIKTPFTPRVLIEGLPGEIEPKWKDINEYNRLRKKEVNCG